MTITATELKTNLGKYLEIVQNEEIIITKNGKEIARLTRPENEKLVLLKQLVGIVSDADYEKTREERLMK